MNTTRALPVVFTGLGVAVVGLLIQFAAEPAKFGAFPPGILFVAAAALIVYLTRRWRLAPLAAVLIAVWIAFGGIASGALAANFASGNGGTIVGNVVMMIGLVVAAVVGIVAMIRPRTGARTRS